ADRSGEQRRGCLDRPNHQRNRQGQQQHRDDQLAQAREQGFEVRVSLLPLNAVPRALVNLETHGIFKLVADARTDRLLGAHVVAENAGDVIYAATLALKGGLTVQDMTSTFAPYLTMAEGLKLAAQTFGKDVARLSCCAG
ncbi:MAG: hypothetical protein C4289_16695, partial [Chloroflexota bacterium]